MRLGSFVPVQEALDIDGIADLEVLHGFINLAARDGQIAAHNKGIHGAVDLQVKIEVAVAVFTGVVVVVEEGRSVALVGHNGIRDLDGLVDVRGKFIRSEHLCDVQRLGDKAVAFHKAEAAIDNLDFAGPFALVALEGDLLAGDQLLIIRFRAGNIVQEIGAVFVSGVDGGLVVPPGKLGLDIGLGVDRRIDCGGGIVCVAHELGRGFGSRSFRGGGRFGFGRGGRRRSGCLGCSRGGGRRSGRSGLSAGGQRKEHGEGKNQGKMFFHHGSPL